MAFALIRSKRVIKRLKCIGDIMINCTALRKQQLLAFGFQPYPNPTYPAGEYFRLNPAYGQGGYWLYDYEALFAISIHDFCFRDDFYYAADMHVPVNPHYLSLSYNIQIEGDFLKSKIIPSKNSITGFVYGEDKIEAMIPGGTKIHSISIEIYPDYYDHLTKRFGLAPDYLKTALLSFQQDSHFYEMMILLQEVKNFKATGLAATLFYESKVTEAIALMLSKIHQTNQFSQEEYLEISALNQYILSHLDGHIAIDQLCKLSLMGKTKLQTQFKKVNQMTISDFIRIQRLEKAKSLLHLTDLSVKDIAAQVGYTNPSRFTELFKAYTHLLPRDYRGKSE